LRPGDQRSHGRADRRRHPAGQPRVYARHDWADRIWAVKKDRGTAPFICEDGAPGNNAFNRITEAVKDHGGPEVTSARLRATWLVWHLERGTRLDVLCEAAGLSTAMSLGALLPHVTPLDPAEAADLVRGLP
jgi:hypothetical protein